MASPSPAVTLVGVVGLGLALSAASAPPSPAQVGIVSCVVAQGSTFGIAEQSSLIAAQPSAALVGPFTVVIT